METPALISMILSIFGAAFLTGNVYLLFGGSPLFPALMGIYVLAMMTVVTVYLYKNKDCMKDMNGKIIVTFFVVMLMILAMLMTGVSLYTMRSRQF